MCIVKISSKLLMLFILKISGTVNRVRRIVRVLLGLVVQLSSIVIVFMLGIKGVVDGVRVSGIVRNVRIVCIVSMV